MIEIIGIIFFYEVFIFVSFYVKYAGSGYKSKTEFMLHVLCFIPGFGIIVITINLVKLILKGINKFMNYLSNIHDGLPDD